MGFDFDQSVKRRGSNSAKWDWIDDDLLPMWVADMDFKSPPVVIDALKDHVEHGVFGYPFFGERGNEIVADWVAKRHQWKIQPEDAIFVPGVVTGFTLASHAVCQPGDGVLVQTPSYGPFLGVAKNVGIVQQEMVLSQREDGSYTIDLEKFEAAITDSTRIFMFCNPHNPTGRVFVKEELEAIAEICLRHEIIICSDEIHSDLVYAGQKHIPIASLDPEIAKNTVTLIAPSKTFNIAGLKSSVAIITDPDLRERYEGAKKGLVGWVNAMGMTALMAAYTEGEEWLDALLVYLEGNRDHLHAFVQEELPGIQMTKPEGTYLAWLDCREMGIEGKASDFFKEHAKVELNEGSWFGNGGEGFIRLNFGCPRSQLDEALEKMKSAIEKR